MRPSPSQPWAVCCLALLVALSSARAEPLSADDEQTLHSAGLPSDGPSLLAFFRARACTETSGEQLRDLLHRFASASKTERGQATAELLGLGPLALPALRQTANDMDHAETAGRASRCLPWLEGPGGHKLLAAAARALAVRKPEGAAAALLTYLPFADDADVIVAVNTALAAVAASGSKPDPALVRGLTDSAAVRRAAAGIALCRAMPPEQVPEVRQLLKDPVADVRLRAALALAEAHDAEAVPVLIALLAELPADKRQPIEEFLTQWAGEWAPVLHFSTDDDISRRIRRDAWAAWWRHTNGAALLAELGKHTLTASKREAIRGLIARTGNEEFSARENASQELFALGRIALPQLREAVKDPDPEIARRTKLLIERIEREPAHLLPLAAVRLLAVRKPAGAVAALLEYLPYAEDEARTEEVRQSLTALALHDGKPDPVLFAALSDAHPLRRATAAHALAHGGGAEGRSAARKLLHDDAPVVRLRIGLALAMTGEREAVPVLIDLITTLPEEQLGEVEAALYQLAGETAPSTSVGTGMAERKKCRDAWTAWWKTNAQRVDLARLSSRPWYGYTLICDMNRNRVYEIDRHGKERWAIENVPGPFDAWVLPGNRVLIAEFNANRITERDFKGSIVWQKQLPGGPSNVQRLPNGNTFVAMNAGPIMEFDRTGKEVYRINNLPGNTLAGYRSRTGVLVCTTWNGRCVLLDTSGKQLKTFATGHDQSSLGGIDLLPNGRILIARWGQGKVAEYDREGKLLLELSAPRVQTASALPNGHILVASQNARRVYEMDRTGKIVWEHKVVGNSSRVRRR